VLAGLTPGDVVMVTRLDRLARSTRDVLNMLATVAEKKAGFRSLGDPLGRRPVGCKKAPAAIERDGDGKPLLNCTSRSR
jgi:DNA invertase Pin-like site-specific DNA recombinase